MYGSGCWAQNRSDTLPGVACSVSGTGEQIMKSQFTMKCMNRMQHQDDIQDALAQALKADFLGKANRKE
jgi:taspase (threonine aspartase 1)